MIPDSSARLDCERDVTQHRTLAVIGKANVLEGYRSASMREIGTPFLFFNNVMRFIQKREGALRAGKRALRTRRHVA